MKDKITVLEGEKNIFSGVLKCSRQIFVPVLKYKLYLPLSS